MIHIRSILSLLIVSRPLGDVKRARTRPTDRPRLVSRDDRDPRAGYIARRTLETIESVRYVVSTPPTHPRIPYGEADFRRIRLNRWLYVDKTRFLRRLEEQERYAFLIRPAPLRQVAVGVPAGELLRPLLGGRLRRHLRRHRHRPAPDRGTEPLRHPALQLLDGQRQARNEREFETYCQSCRGHWSGTCFPKRCCSGPTALHPPSLLFRYSGDHDIPVRADRLRQLRQHRAGVPRRRGVPLLHPRRRLLPQLLRHPEAARTAAAAAWSACSSPACRRSPWTT